MEDRKLTSYQFFECCLNIQSCRESNYWPELLFKKLKEETRSVVFDTNSIESAITRVVGKKVSFLFDSLMPGTARRG